MQTIHVLKVCLSFAASFLHCIGFWALWNVKQRNPYLVTQRLYLLHLSLSENTHSFFLGLYYILTIYERPKWANYAFICAGGGAFIWYLSIMIMLTVDRFLTVYLNVRYLSVWNVRKTKRVLAICFSVGFLLNILFLVTIPTFDESLEIFSVYLWFPVDNLFTILAVLTYVYIFRRVYSKPKSAKSKDDVTPTLPSTPLRHNKKRTYSNASTTKVNISLECPTVATIDKPSSKAIIASPHSNSLVTMSTKPKFPLRTFMIPLLLITTFIVFIGFPDNTYFWYFVLKKEVPHAMDTVFFIFYPAGIMSDAIIYVLCAKDVRSFLFTKLGISSAKSRRAARDYTSSQSNSTAVSCDA